MWGLLAVLVATAAWGLDNTLSRTLAARDPGQVVLAKAGLGAIATSLVAVSVGEHLPTPGAAFGLFAVGVTGYGLSLRFYLLAQRAFGAARTGSVFAFAPFIGAALAVSMGDHSTSWLMVAGSVLMLTGVSLHLAESHGRLRRFAEREGSNLARIGALGRDAISGMIKRLFRRLQREARTTAETPTPPRRNQMIRRTLMLGALALTLAAGTAVAQDTVKIGLILPMTGPFASTGRQIDGAVKLWLAQNGTTVAGKKIEVILKDDAGTADTTRRLAQELVVNDKVQVLAGFGLTPLALATVPIATQAKIPELVMAAATSSITEQSAYVIRAGFTLPQITVPLADWAAKNGIKKVVTLVTDYGPGIDAETAFKTRFTAAGGEVPAELRVPLRNPDFAPFLQRVVDAKPDAVFVFVPSGVGSIFMR